MEVRIGTSRFTPVPDELEPLVRAYAGVQGRTVTRAPSGVLTVSDPPAPDGLADLTVPQPLIRTSDGCWTSPRARARLNANRRE